MSLIALSNAPICGHCRRFLENTGKRTAIRHEAMLHGTAIYECKDCGNTVLLPDGIPFKPTEPMGDYEEVSN